MPESEAQGVQEDCKVFFLLLLHFSPAILRMTVVRTFVTWQDGTGSEDCLQMPWEVGGGEGKRQSNNYAPQQWC